MLQERLWPLRIVEVEPYNVNTLRLRMRGIGDDGMPYFLKSATPSPAVPASELLCSSLATAVGLVVPNFNVALMPGTGEEVFASRQENGIDDSLQWFESLVAGSLPENVQRQLSMWFAFDLFVNNPDRHINNFLCRNVGGLRTVHGFDFSEAFIQAGWPPSLVMRRDSNTILFRRALQGYMCQINKSAAIDVLARLRSLPVDWMAEAIRRVPLSWMDDALRASVDAWWREERQQRAFAIEEAIQNDHYN